MMAGAVREHAETVGRAHLHERTFRDVAEDWLRHGERKRGLKRSTLYDYRRVLDAYLLPAFGDVELARLTTGAIERWHADYRRSRTAEKLLMVLRGILNYAVRQGWLADNPAKAVEHHPVRYSGDYDLYSREEVEALVRNAASEQDAAIYASAAMTGLRRGELVALEALLKLVSVLEDLFQAARHQELRYFRRAGIAWTITGPSSDVTSYLATLKRRRCPPPQPER